MKNLYILLLCFTVAVNAQVGIGTTKPDSSSVLDVYSNDKGILLPRLLEAEKDSIKNPADGLIVYQTDTLQGFHFYNKNQSNWLRIKDNGTTRDVLCSNVVTVETISDLEDVFSTCGNDITTVIVLGYHVPNDGGGGIFVYDASMSNVNDGGLVFDGWKRSVVDGAINVKWYGAIDGDDINNVPANTQAFQSAITELSTRFANPVPGVYSVREAKAGIFIPSGQYMLGQESLFKQNFPNNSPLSGITFFSDGNAILNATNEGSGYLFYNNNKGQFITFKNITFLGTSSKTNLFFSTSTGQAQDYYFERCSFKGIFGRIFTIRGSNTNSEWGFSKCAFTCETDVVMDIRDSDQFLNYWFDQTKFWLYNNSRTLYSTQGGHFKFTNCDWSGLDPSYERYQFELHSTAGAGVNDLRILNSRFELKTDYARVLKTDWQTGNIEITADFGSQAFNNVNVKHFDFRIRENSALNISFKNSVMMGFHNYRYSNSSWKGTARATYENCAFPGRSSLDDFIVISDNLLNKSGISLISIEDSIFQTLGTNNSEVTSVDFLPLYSNRGIKKKYVRIGHSATGRNPYGFQQFTLNFPEEAESIITKITWILPPGEINSGSGSFRLTKTNGSTIASVSGNMSQGFREEDNVFINVKDLPNGKLVLKASGVNNHTDKFLCLIEYL